MVDAESTAGRFGRVRWPDSLLSRSNRRTAELNLLEAVDDLVKVEDEVRAIRDEEATVAVEACVSS